MRGMSAHHPTSRERRHASESRALLRVNSVARTNVGLPDCERVKLVCLSSSSVALAPRRADRKTATGSSRLSEFLPGFVDCLARRGPRDARRSSDGVFLGRARFARGSDPRTLRRVRRSRFVMFLESVRRDRLQLPTQMLLAVVRQVELPDEAGKLLALFRQGVAGGRRLFGQGGVLLGDLIHLIGCGVDLFERVACSWTPAAMSVTTVLISRTFASIRPSASPVLVTRSTPSLTCAVDA